MSSRHAEGTSATYEGAGSPVTDEPLAPVDLAVSRMRRECFLCEQTGTGVSIVRTADLRLALDLLAARRQTIERLTSSLAEGASDRPELGADGGAAQPEYASA